MSLLPTMIDGPANLRGAFSLNYQALLDSCLRSEFAFLEYVLDVKADVLLGRLEKLSHSSLREPNRLAVQSHLEPQAAVAINEHLARWDRLRFAGNEFVAHVAFPPICHPR